MKYLIFGTGDYYNRYKKWFAKEDIVALLDNAPHKQNTYIDNIQIVSPQQGVQLAYDAVVILSFYVKGMKRQLRELGVPEERIFHFYDLHKLICRAENGVTGAYKKPIQYYGGAENREKASCTLLLSQDLTLGGPAIALFHMARVLRDKGDGVVFASMLDGPLRDILLAEGIPVIVDVNLQIETMREAGWTAGFSRIVCNTINYHVFLSKRDTQIPILWWLHDSPFFYDGVDRALLSGMERKNLRLCSVGPVPRAAMAPFMPDLEIENLIYGVVDEADEAERKPDRHKVRFVTIGYIEARKGQDILVRAVRRLPQSIRERAEFYLIGQNTSRMAEEIKTMIQELPEIVMTGTMDREGIHKAFAGADMAICPSREDPMPTVAAEAMMHRVPCMVSDATGTASFIEQEVNGIVFQNGDEQELAERICWCVEHHESLPDMGLRARTIYEQHFSMAAFEKKVRELL